MREQERERAVQSPAIPMNELQESFEELSSAAQCIAEVLALHHFSLSESAVCSVLQGALSAADSPLQEIFAVSKELPKDVRLALAELNEAGVVQRDVLGFKIRENLQNIACFSARDSGRLAILVEEIARNAWPGVRNREDSNRWLLSQVPYQELLWAIVAADERALFRALSEWEAFGKTPKPERVHLVSQITASVWCNPFCADLIRTLPSVIFASTLRHQIIERSFAGADLTEARDLLLARADRDIKSKNLLFLCYVLMGEVVQARRVFASTRTAEQVDYMNIWRYRAEAVLALQLGNYQQAAKVFNAALGAAQAAIGRSFFFDDWLDLLHVVALLAAGESRRAGEASWFIATCFSKHRHRNLLVQLYSLLKAPEAGVLREATETEEFSPNTEGSHGWGGFLELLVMEWGGRSRPLSEKIKTLEAILEQAALPSQRWLIAEVSYQLEKLATQSDVGDGGAAALAKLPFFAEHNAKPIAKALESKSSWENALEIFDEVSRSLQSDAVRKPQEHRNRLIWILTEKANGGSEILAHLQMRRKDGKWGQAKPIALDRLVYSSFLPVKIDASDRKIAAALFAAQATGGLNAACLKLFVGHKSLFVRREKRLAQIDVVLGKPRLIVSRSINGGWCFRLLPHLPEELDFALNLRDEHTYELIEFVAELRKLGDFFSATGQEVEIPAVVLPRVQAAFGSLCRVIDIQGELEGFESQLPVVMGDSKLRLRLLPDEGQMSLYLSLVVYPHPRYPGCFPAGEGPRCLIFYDDHAQGQSGIEVRRNLELESDDAAVIVSHLGLLPSEHQPERDRWHLPDLERSLEVLAAIRESVPPVTVEWPRKSPFEVVGSVSNLDSLMRVSRQGRDFYLQGGIRVAEKQVLSFADLLERMDRSGFGRFIEISDAKFVALSRTLHQKLVRLKRVSMRQEKGLENGDDVDRGVRIHPLASNIIEELFDESLTVESDLAWQEHVESMAEARSYEPSLPPTLTAKLRPYQLDGVKWLARLGRLGAGACLADDMGLGKTIQALIALQHFWQSQEERRTGVEGAGDVCQLGPALVVAPTSVCGNWIEEAARFTPSLRLHTLERGRRSDVINSLQTGDILVCSYALLQRDEIATLLQRVEWEVIILDEAQAVKNYTTVRSQVVRALKSRWRIATTGTPIENRLGELWSLFSFLNPGLLGSARDFSERFVTPIEGSGDKDALESLRELTQPFILRRRKEDVLMELPPKTEIQVDVELEPQEAAFYEALRRKTVKELEELVGDDESEQNKITFFAALTKLRRAACNPFLVEKGVNIGSTKQDRFLELVDDLLSNGHRALVFSQFVDQLQILAEALRQKGVSFQYLDGSTPAAVRRQSIKKFQEGEGELFLISLRAGGVGLNLTAADYVIHMDPWWNPAVEDQASDRAHRIGQTKPVTVYRLISKGTIEEAVMSLHQTKRALAEDILSDMAGVTKLSTRDLFDLIATGAGNRGVYREENASGGKESVA